MTRWSTAAGRRSGAAQRRGRPEDDCHRPAAARGARWPQRAGGGHRDCKARAAVPACVLPLASGGGPRRRSSWGSHWHGGPLRLSGWAVGSLGRGRHGGPRRRWGSGPLWATDKVASWANMGRLRAARAAATRRAARLGLGYGQISLKLKQYLTIFDHIFLEPISGCFGHWSSADSEPLL